MTSKHKPKNETILKKVSRNFLFRKHGIDSRTEEEKRKELLRKSFDNKFWTGDEYG